jgi:hypothetical protein
MDTMRAVAFILNGVVVLGSLYLATNTGAGSRQNAIAEGAPWLGMTIMAFVNVVLLYHRKGGSAAYIPNGLLISAGVFALLLNSFLAGFFEDRDAIALVGSTAIAAAVVNVIALRKLSMRHSSSTSFSDPIR